MNIIVKSSCWKQEDIPLLYGDINSTEIEDVIYVEDIPIPNLLVNLGIFKSTSQARRAGRTGNIPKGWTQYKASRKTTLWIWNPTE